ncbi:hypothetical protein VP01_748g5 [Puccinia sorghi]|uniref:Yeast cell wall synthesis Kre9/Knh1-like N-terminal domain-containing protein n=1 Tax=Puccinia sorghi TaxID=27349 RepID=A0A0L6UC88_9BASI|nr:hypothetical protein VP01_748g5 [Puccinia sorghi]
MISGLTLSLLFVAGARAAGVVPTAPGPGESFKEGGECSISWNLDTTGKWTNFSIDLMSGSNTAMNTITNVVTGRDGTKGETTLKWKCPSVTPHSAIYFYQFTQPGADTTWTTRFTIASPTGEVTAPANSVYVPSSQPDGAKIPWGTGQLAGAGAASAADNTTTTAPSPSANTTSINTPVANTTSPTNSTVGPGELSIFFSNTTTSVTGHSGTTTTPTQSTTPLNGSNSKPSSSSSPITTPKTGSDSSASLGSSGASAIQLCKSAAVAVTLAVVVIIAC